MISRCAWIRISGGSFNQDLKNWEDSALIAKKQSLSAPLTSIGWYGWRSGQANSSHLLVPSSNPTSWETTRVVRWEVRLENWQKMKFRVRMPVNFKASVNKTVKDWRWFFFLPKLTKLVLCLWFRSSTCYLAHASRWETMWLFKMWI